MEEVAGEPLAQCTLVALAAKAAVEVPARTVGTEEVEQEAVTFPCRKMVETLEAMAVTEKTPAFIPA